MSEIGFGLWAVILKEGNEFIGDCGITMQEVEGQSLPEIGYHIIKEYCRRGYASEAANACIDFAFTVKKMECNLSNTSTKSFEEIMSGKHYI